MRAWGDVGRASVAKSGASSRGSLRGRSAPERGSEIVQSVVAVPLVLLVVFAATVQAGGMMLSVNRLTADLARACRQMDTAGLALAVDRERFVADEVLGAATQLKPDLLTVSNVRSEVLGAVQGARFAPGATSRAAGEEGAGAGAGDGAAHGYRARVVRRALRAALPDGGAGAGPPHDRTARRVRAAGREGSWKWRWEHEPWRHFGGAACRGRPSAGTSRRWR